MKFRLFLGFFIALGVSSALAGAIKVWVSGDTLTSTDLNANFAHIHNTMVGGHGARLVDADITTAVSIRIPKAWAYVAPSCGASPCALAASTGVASITRIGAGSYSVNLTNARANAVYGVVCSGQGAAFCGCGPVSASAFSVLCYDTAMLPVDVGFTALVMDDN